MCRIFGSGDEFVSKKIFPSIHHGIRVLHFVASRNSYCVFSKNSTGARREPSP
jgi:hypothetical protein